MENARQLYLARHNTLRQDRSTWLQTWRELAEFVRPKSYRYMLTETNKGWRRDSAIINNTGGRALRTAAAGMMAGITSPSRPWFMLGLHDEDRSEYPPVRDYLDKLTSTVRRVLAGSNVYRGLHKTYDSLLLMGTAVLFLDEDDKKSVRAYDFPIGQYCLANSSRQEIDSCFREYRMTVRQLVQKFGIDKLSTRLRDMYNNGNGRDEWVDVTFVVEPNTDYVPGKLGPKGMAFRSCWYETASDPLSNGFLKEGGYYSNPVLCPRWDTTGEDVYGLSPGMSCIGDIRALQQLERNKGKAVEKIVDPPMVGPVSLQNMRSSIVPGGITYVDAVAQGQTFKPAMEIPPAAIQVVEGTVREHEQRIQAEFFEDLWMAMARDDESRTPQMTAREVAERHEEKLTQLGPVMENLDRELLGPLIERVIDILMRTPGALPPPPPEAQGQDVSIEYISIVAQAQKMLGISSIERLSSFIGNWATQKPEVLDKIDIDATVDEYAQDVGVKGALIVPTEKAQQIRDARAHAQAQQAQQQQALAMAQGAKTLSQADTGGDNALTRLMQGVPTAAGGA